jgi:hypothetical protein
MGRPSKLNDRQKAEIGRRLAKGETTRALAKEFKVSQALISGLFSGRVETIKNLAGSLATTEAQIDALPVSDQVAVRDLADNLKGIAHMGAKAAATGMKTADLLHTEALRSVQQVLSTGLPVAPEELRGAAACLEVAGKAAALGATFLNANKDNGKKDGEPTLEELVAGARP